MRVVDGFTLSSTGPPVLHSHHGDDRFLAVVPFVNTATITQHPHNNKIPPVFVFADCHPLTRFLLSFCAGGLGVMLVSRPFPQWSVAILNARLEVRSMFLATVVLFVVLVLAYVSNPSESSFRSYLTEQSFRQHLSRLDDKDDADHTDSEDSGVHYSRSRSTSSSAASLESGSSAVHFSNRASVAIRTPKHDFHSFGFFTIAAVLPNNKQSSSRSSSSAVSPARSDRDGSALKDAWFIGAFGRWWRGVLVDASWSTPPQRKAKCDEEAWSSGILTARALDKLDKHDGLPLPTTTSPPRTGPRLSPPKLRSRDRSRPRLPTSRSTTPPPLPKGVTLPLHTPRHSPSLVVPQAAHTTLAPPPVAHPPPPAPHITAPPPSYDSAPAVVELLRQIAATRTGSHELRVQLNEHATTATAVEEGLTAELAAAREAKRLDDTGRADLRTRTKTLEENKRVAEAGRREAERRLRVAQGAVEEASARATALGAEIAAFEGRVRADAEAADAAETEALHEEEALLARLEHKKKEVRVAEDVVAALGVRARELEDAIEHERAALERSRNRAELLQQDRNFLSLTVVKPAEEMWEPIPASPEDVFPTPLEKDSDLREGSGSGSSVSGGSHSRELSASPRPRPLNLRSVSNLPFGSTRAKGYSLFDEDIAALPPAMTFAPFDADTDPALSTSPTAAALLPNSLIQSPADEAPLSASFQSDGDAFLDRNWRAHAPIDASAVGSTSPPSGRALHHTEPAVEDYDPFEVRVPPIIARPAWPAPAQPDSEPTRRWWPGGQRKGLNPAAKEFRVKPAPAPALFDSLNPSSSAAFAAPAAPSATGFFSSLAMRAFVPSPAEREALQRALGGSTNTSLERLPSLSEVQTAPGPAGFDAVDGGSGSSIAGGVQKERGWLAGLGLAAPRSGKMKFSPWGDGEEEAR